MQWGEHPLLRFWCVALAAVPLYLGITVPRAGCTHKCVPAQALSHIPCSSRIPGTQCWRGVWRSHPAESWWMYWWAGLEQQQKRGSQPAPCSEHGGIVLGWLSPGKCCRAPNGETEMKSNLWAFIWRFLHCVCAEGSLVELHLTARSIIWVDTVLSRGWFSEFAVQTTLLNTLCFY